MSSVTDTSSLGSSDSVTGLKRVSPRADVRAYEASPEESGWDSKVPMQPRRRGAAWGKTLFQVTKRGDSVMLERWDVRRAMPMGVKEGEEE